MRVDGGAENTAYEPTMSETSTDCPTRPFFYQGAVGNRLAASRVGPETGHPVLLVHGGGQTRHAWDETADALAARGWRAIAFDQRGHGQSDWIENGDYSYTAYASDLAAVARAIEAEYGRRPVIIGASLGGVSGILVAGEIPDPPLSALVLVDITAAGNHMLAQFGRKPIDPPRYRYLAGQGVEWLVREALGDADEQMVARGVAVMRGYIEVHRHGQTRLYDGVAEMLDRLQTAGITLAVLSNKPDEGTQEVVGRLLARWRFAAVAGAKPDVPLKPDAGSALAIAAEVGIEPAQWAYLGDTRVDMLTAAAAGMYAIGCTWGFRDEAELRESGAKAIVHHPGEVVELVAEWV